MVTATQQDLVFNNKRCAIHQSQISFYGTVFTVQGIKPYPTKVQALQDLPALENQNNSSPFRLNKLLATLPPWPCIKNYLSKGDKLGLEPLH